MVALRVLCLLLVGAAALKVKSPTEAQDPSALKVDVQEAQELDSEEGQDGPLLALEPGNVNPRAILTTTMGEMEVELFMDKAPITVSNFIDLAKKGFYNGLHFHRVIPNFMVQFGCPFSADPHSSSAGTGGPAPKSEFKGFISKRRLQRDTRGNIRDECPEISNKKGTLAMANTGQPNSGGSQFFVNVADNAFLDCFDNSTKSNHPVFGRVLQNLPAAVKMSQVNTTKDNPVEPIKMIKVDIMAFGIKGPRSVITGEKPE
jgi:cyclophilin family peptidyl-prolyl cis-trans isomerase